MKYKELLLKILSLFDTLDDSIWEENWDLVGITEEEKKKLLGEYQSYKKNIK